MSRPPCWSATPTPRQFHPAHGISDADLAWLQSRGVPQPIGTYGQAAITEPLTSGPADLGYVRCLKTDPRVADRSTLLGLEQRTLDAGHWPMITDPQDTARLVIELAGA